MEIKMKACKRTRSRNLFPFVQHVYMQITNIYEGITSFIT